MQCNSSLPSLQNTSVRAYRILKAFNNLFGLLLILKEAPRFIGQKDQDLYMRDVGVSEECEEREEARERYAAN